MSIITTVTSCVIPVFILLSVFSCIAKKQNPYSVFIDGAADGIENVKSIIPYMVAIIFAIKLFNSSGIAKELGSLIDTALASLGIPKGLGVFLTLRPLSGSGALAELNNIFASYGVDSPQGLFASTVMGSTETIFYTIAVYLSPSGIKNSPKALWISLISMISGLLFTSLLFSLFPIASI
ncbi:MAG: spore maturation protein [Clostridia bacterium]|nr:spore maturation protein [Clostridia bacterium]